MTIRTVHLVAGLCLAVVIYAPASWSEPVRLLLGVVVVPAAALTGLALWQQGRLRRFLRSRQPSRTDDRSEVR